MKKLFALRDCELDDGAVRLTLQRMCHARTGGMGVTVLEDEFVDFWFPRLPPPALLPSIGAHPRSALALGQALGQPNGALLLSQASLAPGAASVAGVAGASGAGESVGLQLGVEPILYAAAWPSWVRLLNLFVALWFFTGSWVGIAFTLSWISTIGLEFFPFLINLPLLLYSMYLIALELRLNCCGAALHTLHVSHAPFLVTPSRHGRLWCDIFMATVAIQLYQTAVVPYNTANAQYVQVFAGILLLCATLLNHYLDAVRAAPKLALLFDRLRPHLQIDASFAPEQRAERAHRNVCAAGNAVELNAQGA